MIQTTTRAWLSLSPPMCLSTRTCFPPNKHFTCFTTFCLYVEIHFYRADGPGPCCWPLVYWLGFSALTAMAQIPSLARNRNPASSCCRLRPPKITPIYTFCPLFIKLDFIKTYRSIYIYGGHILFSNLGQSFLVLFCFDFSQKIYCGCLSMSIDTELLNAF